VPNRIRAAYYLRVSTEGQELENQRGEIVPFIDRRGWKLECAFEDIVSGGKTEKDRPGFAAMLKAAHQRKFDVLVFWALDRLTREGTRATLNYLQRLESKGVDYVSYQEQWLDSTGPFKDVMISMFATLAKQERARISERTIAGLKIARAKGKRLGRPLLDPTAWTLDQVGLDRPGNAEIQLDLFYDYRTNVPLYPQFQAFFRQHQPPTLIVWGKNDFIFPPAGATPYQRDLRNVETHLLDTGHFALETHGEEIASRIEEFLRKHKLA
jgi:DNA invertase Pin-like site-specific DNA recombinase